MRVLLITSVFPRFESDDQVPWLRETCRRVKESGVEVEVLAPAHKGLQSHTIDGIPVHRFRYAPARWETLTGEEGAPSKVRRNPLLVLLAGMYLWSGFWAVAGLLLKKKFDVIEVHWPFPLALMALPAVVAGVPLVYHYHSAELKLAAQNPLANLLFSWSMGWAKAHVANSSYTAALIKKLRPKIEIEVIPYGSPIKLQAQAQTKPARRKLLFVGRHIERKGITYLIEAMNILPQDFLLTIVGEGDQTDALKKQAAGDARIRFAGRLSGEELAASYMSADIFILPAIVDGKGDTEGLGVVLIEAVAAGLPIVASNVGGIPDVVINNETGCLVEEKNPAALVKAILRLGEDEALAQKLVEGAKIHAQKYFSWEAVIGRTLELYKRVALKTS